MKSIVFLASLLLLPLNVYSHGSGFFEFAPDSSKGLFLSSVTNPIEIFLPQNDFLNGIDIWVDNSGSAGTLTVELRNQNNVLVTSKTINVNHIDPVSGGSRIHLDFSGQVGVSGNQKYKLKFVTSMPNLNLYYSNRINIIGHNEPYISEYINGVANINNEDKDFSFKFALYESSETSVPIISNVSVIALSPNQAQVEFNVNESMDYKINYGIEGQGENNLIDYDGDLEYCGAGVSFCRAMLTTQPNEDYAFTLTVKDSWGNEAVYSGTFSAGVSTTATPTPSESQTPEPSGPDTESPIITNVQVVGLTLNSAGFSWHTNEAANSYAAVRTLPEYITAGFDNDSTFELEHFLEIGNLQADSFYTANITSADIAGNEVSVSVNFQTLKNTPVPTVTPSQSPTPTPTVQINPNNNEETEVVWQGNENAQGFKVDVFDSNNNLVYSKNVPAGERSLSLGSLPKGEYTVIVYENSEGAYKKITPPQKVKVGNDLLKYLPYLLGALAILAFAAWKMKIFSHGKTSTPPNNLTPPK